MTSNISSSILRSWRERPPSSYSFKIKNFSKLEGITLQCNGKYKSRRFSSGGYKWRMIIYPKGNDKDNGSGFISMYLEIDTTSLVSTPQPHEVYADVRFFIFNKKENKYLTIQDVDPKPFNTIRKIFGFPQVLPIVTINDLEKGYIFSGDQCEFGVDIIVAPPPTNWETLSLDVKLPDPKFSCTIKHFFEIKENPYVSDSFSVGGKNWLLKLHPKGYSSLDSGKWLSIFLYLADDEILKEDEQIYVQVIMKVKDPRGSNDLTKTMYHWFNTPGSGCGYPKLVTIAELRKSYLDKEETLTVKVEFKVVSATKYSSFT